MQSENARKKLFKILENFANGRQSQSDFKKIISLILYNTPYKNPIVFPSSKRNLKFTTGASLSKDFRGRAQLSALLDAKANKRPIIEINTKDCRKIDENHINILTLFNTIAHEYTHTFQDKMSTIVAQGKSLPSEKMKTVLESQETLLKQDTLLQALILLQPHVSNNTEFLEDMHYLFYMQLPYEENARECGFRFAKEMFFALTSDEHCNEKIKDYLTACKLNLDQEWKNEEQMRLYYAPVRQISENIQTHYLQTDKKHMFVGEYLIKESVSLARMRTEKVDKETYFACLVKSGHKITRYDSAYLEGEDLSKLLLGAVASGKLPISKLLDSKPFVIKITADQIANACISCVDANGSNQVFTLLYNLPKNRKKKVFSALEEKNFTQHILDKIEVTVKNFDPKTTSQEECENYNGALNLLYIMLPAEEFEKCIKDVPPDVAIAIDEKSKAKQNYEQE